MIFNVWSDGRFELGGASVACALGREGVIEAAAKREGDGKTPLGVWPVRRLLYRPDKGGAPKAALTMAAIRQNDGWCDAPCDPAYNRPVTLPYPVSAEAMWRDDDLYDLVVVLGHNDSPPRSGMGSAIFLHLAKPGYAPTEGCIALSRPDMERFLSLAKPSDSLAVLLAR
jgi:L,D-peptidoglycan transpeptidase YkuD (ErfK/YbiS/YcfS/YnhG family)